MIVDTFPFFNEYELCEIRLRYLDSVVDKFVITESNLTWTCKPNKQKFHHVLKRLPKALQDKIVYEFIEYPDDYIDNEEHVRVKTTQNFSRDRLIHLTREFTDDALVFYSDLDEIWDKRKLHVIKKELEDKKVILCANDFRIVFVDWKTRIPLWPGSQAMYLKNMPEERPLSRGDFIYTKSKSLRKYDNIECGWHFSYFGSPKQREQKMRGIKNGQGWEERKKMSFTEIANHVRTREEWNQVAKKKKMGADQIIGDLKLDPELEKLFEKVPAFYSQEYKK